MNNNNDDLLTKEHYSSLFNNNPDAVFSFDTNGKFLSANKSLAKLVECSVEKLLEITFVPFLPAEDFDRVMGHFQKALTGEAQNYNSNVVTSTGKKLVVNITNFPIIIKGEIIGVYGIAKDITKMIIAEKSLKKSQERLQKIMDRSLDIICTIDGEGRFVQVSKASSKILGYEPEEIVGMSSLKLTHKDDREKTIKIAREVIQGGEATNFENRYLRKDGKYIPLLWSARWYPEEALLYSVARDATEIKRTEEKLVNYANKLKRSNDELEQFAYIASHDLQEPLRMVTSFLSQLERKYKPQLDEKAGQYIHFAVDGATRMRRIILDLLEYSRIGRKEYQIEKVDINNVVSEALKLNQTTIEEKNAVVEWDNLPAIMASRVPLQHLFQNLISNGLKYQKEDNQPIIKISAKETQTHWQFSVKDNGIGIAPQFHDKIFAIFQRLHGNQEYTGSGIGLSICKKIVENFKGQMWVDSDENKGTNIYFTISKVLE